MDVAEKQRQNKSSEYIQTFVDWMVRMWNLF